MLYIHIPYCKGKCLYCNFYSGGAPSWERYLKAVESELTHRIEELKDNSLSSIYIGGGTPSLIPPEFFSPWFESIISIIRDAGIIIKEDAEITIEVNPEDVTATLIESWKRAGVNRVSMGVQSLNDEELKFLKRRHTSKRALEALRLLTEFFSNVSVDVIYGIPGQTTNSLNQTIEQLLNYPIVHLSAYALTYEPGTPLWILAEKNEVRTESEDEYLILESELLSLMEKRGFERYEISNFSRRGFQSRHNSGYWNGKPYIGLGPSASSFDGNNIRRNNPSDLKGYMRHWAAGEIKLPFYTEEKLSQEERLEEIIFTSLRTSEGLNLTQISDPEIAKKIMKAAMPWVKGGQATHKNDMIQLTKTGFNISDYIILEIISKIF